VYEFEGLRIVASIIKRFAHQAVVLSFVFWTVALCHLPSHLRVICQVSL
jgi:hypothetical protein